MKLRPALLVLVVASAAVPLACGSSSTSSSHDAGPDGQGGAAGQGGSGGQAGAYDGGGGSTPDGGGGSDAGTGGAGPDNCAAPTGTPIVHDTDITHDETWAADSVHVVQSSLSVIQGVTLKIDPCAVVEITADEYMAVDGELDAQGKAGQPVTFKRHDSGPWAYLAVHKGGQIKLAYSRLQGGGADSTADSGATIVADGGGGSVNDPLEPVLAVDHVTVSGSAGYGVLLRNSATFAAGSTGLLVTGSGASVSQDPYPMRIPANALGTLPDGAYTGNAEDAVDVDVTPGTGVTADTTIKDPGVPYHVDGFFAIYPLGSAAGPTLTIQPGVELDFEKFSDIDVSGDGTKLDATGTAAKPILMKRAGADAWDGVVMDVGGAASLSYVTLDGGGGDIPNFDGASLVVRGPNSAPVVPRIKVDHVSVTNSVGYGVSVGRYAGFTSDSTALTVSGSGASDADHPRPLLVGSASLGTIPDGTYTGNADDRIEVSTNNGAVFDTSMTVHDRGVPYYFSEGYTVDQGSAATAPKVTLEAGTQLQFDPDASYSGLLFLTVSQGSIEADGTAQKPVVFSSAAKAPGRGDWVGIEFDSNAAAFPQKLDHTIVEYAGADSGVATYTCDPIVSGNPLPENAAVLIVGWAPSWEFITNTQIKRSGGHGILRGWDLTQGVATDFTQTNTFDPAPGGYLDQTQPPDPGSTPSCP